MKRGTASGFGFCVSDPSETLRIEAGVSVKSIIGLTSIFGIATVSGQGPGVNWVGRLIAICDGALAPGDKIEMTRLKQSVVEPDWMVCHPC